MSNIKLNDISSSKEQLVELTLEKLPRLPYPYDKIEDEPPFKSLSEDEKSKLEHGLDGVIAADIPKPKTKQEEEILVKKFLNGFKKLLSENDNWTFLQPLLLSLEYCAKCQTCSDACPIYVYSGKQEIYRPTFRSEILRRIYRKYIKPGGKLFSKFTGSDIDLNWQVLARLCESAYRCTLCRRCAQTCPIGIDNGLISHEIRKLFSQQLGIAAKNIHELGSQLQLKKGSSTGQTPQIFLDNVEFMEDDIKERTGLSFKWPIDKVGADILLIHNAGEYLAWPENPEAFAIIFEAAGVNYTLSSDLVSYDAVNYGLWYDDVQLAKVVLKHIETAKKLGVKKIIIGECGHAHKAISVVADRILTGDNLIPRESSMTFIADLIKQGRLKLDPSKNADINVTLHDPCNMVRLMGIVKPQRDIIKAVVPPENFREMNPHGVYNYCCGGGSGFAIMSVHNFPQWRHLIPGRVKMNQILNVWKDIIDPEHKKYLATPCSNCKGQFREVLNSYNAFDKCNILYGGIVELVVNALTDIKSEEPFLEWDWH